MKRTVVVDSSIVAKWLVPEIDSDAATSIRDDHDFIVPDLLFAELANILWKKWHRKEVSEADVADALFALDHATFDVCSTRAMLAEVARLSRHLDHPAYDCFYLWCAAERETVLITADDRLLRKLRSQPDNEWAPLAFGLAEYVHNRGYR